MYTKLRATFGYLNKLRNFFGEDIEHIHACRERLLVLHRKGRQSLYHAHNDCFDVNCRLQFCAGA